MKRCPLCRQTYADETLKFCRDDGSLLQGDSSAPDELADTRLLSAARTGDVLGTQLLRRDGTQARESGAPSGGGNGSGTVELKAGGGVHVPPGAGGAGRQRAWARIIPLGLLALAVIGLGTWAYKSSGGESRRPSVSFQSAKFTRLTSTGRVTGAAVSPDGRYVAHVVDEGGQQSLWVRQTATPSDVQIVPPARVAYRGLTFSPDGDYVYYTVYERDAQGALYQVPALGGTARKLLAGINSAVTFSPDGRQMAFIRRSIVEGAREDALTVVNADGTGERKLASKIKDERFMRGSGGFSGPSWSPDGKTIACPFGNTLENFMTVAAVSVESGEAKVLTDRRWFAVRQVAWLADGDRILFNAMEHSAGAPYQLWQVSAATGEAQRVTNDLTDYRSFSLNPDSDTLVAIEGEAVSNIWVMPATDSGRATQITSGKAFVSDVTWTPDGRLIYLSNANGSVDLYQMDARGGGSPKQLTANSRSNRYPSVTRDGRYVVYMSDQAGRPNIWRMDADGGNQKQLTDGADLYPYVSPDGRWVVYQSWAGEARVRKVPLDGGQFVQLTDYPSGTPVVSPDGKYVACTYQEQTGAPLRLAILPPEGGRPLKSFPLPAAGETDSNIIRWTPDGREIVYARTSEGVSNLWAQPVAGGQPRQLTSFAAERIFWFDFSHDGRQLAVARGQQLGDVVLIKDFR